MRKSHANESISFLMELTFVLFFFTLAGAVCMLVLETAKDKDNLVADTRNVLQYGENLVIQRKIPQAQQTMQKKIFYLDENGNRSSSQAGYYRVETEQKRAVEKSGRTPCELYIYRDDKELVRLPFLLEGDVQE